MPTSAIDLEQYTEVLNGNLPKIDRNVYQRTPPEYMKFAAVSGTVNQVDEFQSYGGLARPIRNRDAEALPQMAPYKGPKSVIRQVPYRSAVFIEKSVMESAKHKEILDNMEDMIEAEKSLRDAVAADMLNNGASVQTATDFTESDGTQRALFSTGHVYEDGGGTFSNFYNVGVPPNSDTLYLIATLYLGRLRDYAGNFIGTGRTFTIITPTSNPDFVKAADQLVMSTDNPETANRAANTVNRRFQFDHQPVNNLTSTTKWYMGISPTSKGYPIQMLVGSEREVSPLKFLDANPDLAYSRLRTKFGVGLRYTARGIVCIGV